MQPLWGRGRGRAFDNIFIKRLWRSLKYEDIYLNDYPSVPAPTAGLERQPVWLIRRQPANVALGALSVNVPQCHLDFWRVA